MNIRTLQRGLKYRGRVKAVRQTYHVFEAQGYFFVLSFALSFDSTTPGEAGRSGQPHSTCPLRVYVSTCAGWSRVSRA